MFKMFLLLIFGFLNIIDQAVVQGEPSLVILTNINKTEITVPSILNLKSGQNLSLTCKTIEIGKNNYLNYPVGWSKQINNYQFQNKTDSSLLRFTSLRVEDGGTYRCTNIKYNLSKNLELIIEPYKSDKKPFGSESRWKRAQHGYGYQWELKTPTPDIHGINLPDHIQEILRKNQDKYGDPWENINKPFQYPSWPDNSNPNQYDWFGEESSGNQNVYHPDVTEAPKKSYIVYYFLGGAGILLLIGGLCIFSQSTTREVPVDAIPLPYYSLNPPANQNNPQPTRREDVNENTTVLSSFLPPEIATIDRGNIQPPRHSDAPPSYDHTVRVPIPSAPPMISSCDVPPSYDEAVANILIRATPAQNSSLSNNLRGDETENVLRSAPLVSRNDI